MATEHLSNGVGPIVVKEPDPLDALQQGLELFLIAREVPLPRKKQVVDVLLAEAALLHDHDCITFEAHDELSLSRCPVANDFEACECWQFPRAHGDGN